jgi:hypothetical protein
MSLFSQQHERLLSNREKRRYFIYENLICVYLHDTCELQECGNGRICVCPNKNVVTDENNGDTPCNNLVCRCKILSFQYKNVFWRYCKSFNKKNPEMYSICIICVVPINGYIWDIIEIVINVAESNSQHLLPFVV